MTAEPGTPREVIKSLDAAYPPIAGRLPDDRGKLRRFVNVYVNEEGLRFVDGLDCGAPQDARVAIIAAVARGA